MERAIRMAKWEAIDKVLVVPIPEIVS